VTPILKGVNNFRDVGGLPVHGGRTVRSGLLFRSGHLAHLTDADHSILNRLGVRLVCDLRSKAERASLPNRLPQGCTAKVLHFDIRQNAVGTHATLASMIKNSPTPEGAHRTMLDAYRSLPEALSGKLQTIVDRILDGDGLPAIVHCHAGKDRTGFVMAMLLSSLGVPLEAIFEDYLATERYLQPGKAAVVVARMLEDAHGTAPLPETLATLMSVRSEYLQASIDTLITRYGSIDVYLEIAAGLTPWRRDMLQELLLQ
jgi:protein-tyrosine phosphatase